MKRRADQITTQHINERRPITLTGTLHGDWTSSRGVHVISVEVAGDAEVEIGGKG